MYWDSQFYVLGLPVLCVRTLSPNTPDSQSKYFGLPVRGLRTVNRYHDILPEICLKAYSTSTRTMS